SQASASSSPGPRQGPWTNATVGNGTASSWEKACCPYRAYSARSASVSRDRKASISVPPQKPSGCADRTTRTSTPGVRTTVATPRANSSNRGGDRALTGSPGKSSQSVATPSSASTRTPVNSESMAVRDPGANGPHGGHLGPGRQAEPAEPRPDHKLVVPS